MMKTLETTYNIKRYAKVIHKHTRQKVTKGVPLNPRQRGIIEAPGCKENGFLLQRIQKSTKRNRKKTVRSISGPNKSV
jgi:hypothetical protein